MSKRPAIASLADDNLAAGGVAAVDRALTLLAAFGNGTSVLSLSALAERTRMYKSTVLRLLASLEHAHLVVHRRRWVLRAGVRRRKAACRLCAIVLQRVAGDARAAGTGGRNP
ncbi:hypothetical protein OKW42_008371 [Paraburkholderia sp. WC7.3d]